MAATPRTPVEDLVHHATLPDGLLDLKVAALAAHTTQTASLIELIGPDTYRTNEPMPLHGTWKTMIRFHEGRAMVAVPVYMPADEALGVPAVTADPQFTRDSQPEWQVLQRETKQDIPSWLWVTCSLVVLACSLALVLSLGWGAQRIGRVGAGAPERSLEPERTAV